MTPPVRTVNDEYRKKKQTPASHHLFIRHFRSTDALGAQLWSDPKWLRINNIPRMGKKGRRRWCWESVSRERENTARRNRRHTSCNTVSALSRSREQRQEKSMKIHPWRSKLEDCMRKFNSSRFTNAIKSAVIRHRNIFDCFRHAIWLERGWTAIEVISSEASSASSFYTLSHDVNLERIFLCALVLITSHSACFVCLLLTSASLIVESVFHSLTESRTDFSNQKFFSTKLCEEKKKNNKSWNCEKFAVEFVALVNASLFGRDDRLESLTSFYFIS